MTKSYVEKLRDPRWQRKRLEIMQRADFACEWCDDRSNTLRIHHGYYAKGLEPWDYEESTLYCLCEKCHIRAEELKRRLYRQLACIHPETHNNLLDVLTNYSATPHKRKAATRSNIEFPDTIEVPVIVVGVRHGQITPDGKGVQEFKSIEEVRAVFPDIDSDKNTQRFTWAMKEARNGKTVRLRFETWEAYKLYSA